MTTDMDSERKSMMASHLVALDRVDDDSFCEDGKHRGPTNPGLQRRGVPSLMYS